MEMHPGCRMLQNWLKLATVQFTPKPTQGHVSNLHCCGVDVPGINSNTSGTTSTKLFRDRTLGPRVCTSICSKESKTRLLLPPGKSAPTCPSVSDKKPLRIPTTTTTSRSTMNHTRVPGYPAYGGCEEN
eukprot:2154896-Rhodomonas_salina.1